MWSLVLALLLSEGDPTPTTQRERCASGEQLISITVDGDKIRDGSSLACYFAVKPKGSSGAVEVEHVRGGVVVATSGPLKWPDDADAGEARACYPFKDVRAGDKMVLSCAVEITHVFGIGLIAQRPTK